MMQRDRKVFGAPCPNQMVQQGRGVEKEKMLVPRSSSPVTVYVELPCIIEQAFSTIAWDDLEDCASGVTHDSALLGYRDPAKRPDLENLVHNPPQTKLRSNRITMSTDIYFSTTTPYYPAVSWWDFQVNDCISEDHDLQDYALDFMADSPATLESSLSPAELVPFQGCVIPPLTPQRDFSGEDSVVSSHTDESNAPAQNQDEWKEIAQCNGSALGRSVEINHQLHKTFKKKQEETDSLQERNLHLKQLACRAKHLAAVLEKLTTVSDPNIREAVIPHDDKPFLSPCKRQRLDEGYETESSDSVEDMLRDISTRCNAVLHSAATGTKKEQESDTIRMFGAFSGLKTSFSNSCIKTDGLQVGENGLSFRASVREHSTIKTQVFAHGHAFTTRTQHGGYRFRWVPSQS